MLPWALNFRADGLWAGWGALIDPAGLEITPALASTRYTELIQLLSIPASRTSLLDEWG
ncbi:hypothetical protein Airi01_102980 [Actinoallomurus iriomotensis]|uniref:Uncharacterized protein n=1 Tax=Actinoallomurus iriomotensis TaxID=478107 RepID=A0A9W6RT20_9ACTN|nr:hypothetical protein Airi01_102980 [Actinoallomurus iriomotensis]